MQERVIIIELNENYYQVGFFFTWLLTQTVPPSENRRLQDSFAGLSQDDFFPKHLVWRLRQLMLELFFYIIIKHVHPGVFSLKNRPVKVLVLAAFIGLTHWEKKRRCCLSIVAVMRNDVFPSAAWALNADSPPVLRLHFQNYNHKEKKITIISTRRPRHFDHSASLSASPGVPVVHQPLRAVIRPILLHIYFPF